MYFSWTVQYVYVGAGHFIFLKLVSIARIIIVMMIEIPQPIR